MEKKVSVNDKTTKVRGKKVADRDQKFNVKEVFLCGNEGLGRVSGVRLSVISYRWSVTGGLRWWNEVLSFVRELLDLSTEVWEHGAQVIDLVKVLPVLVSEVLGKASELPYFVNGELVKVREGIESVTIESACWQRPSPGRFLENKEGE